MVEEREPGCRVEAGRELHEYMLANSTLYQYCVENNLPGLATELSLREAQRRLDVAELARRPDVSPIDKDIPLLTEEELQQGMMRLRIRCEGLEELLKKREREKQSVEMELLHWKRVYLDKPEDRLYHASDRTWWKRVGDRLVRADPPPG